MMQLERIWPLRPSWYLNWLKCQLNYDWSWSDGSAFLMFFSPQSKASESLRASSHTSVWLSHLPGVETETWSVALSVGLFYSLMHAVHFLFSDPFTINVCSFILHCKTFAMFFLRLYSVWNSEHVIYKCLLLSRAFTENPNKSNKMGEKSYIQNG